MDDSRFDALAKSLAAPRTRRGALRAALAALAGGLLASRADEADAAARCASTRDCTGVAGTVCVNRRCVCTGGARACHDPFTGQLTCTDLAGRNDNCGHCGHQCGECVDGVGAIHSEACVAGQCAPPVGFTTCGGGQCADLRSDHHNCGACHNGCTFQEACVNGQCQVCPKGAVFCKSVNGCANLFTDPRNCGTCGNACLSGAACVGGVCQPCAAGLTKCGSACLNLQTDSQNCGACGHACDFNSEHCASGVCVCNNPAHTQCPDGCFDLQSSNAACGSCGHNCGACDLNGGQMALDCVHGQCTGPQGYLACSGICVDYLHDRDNCGACGLRCATIPPAQECDNGQCVDCANGWAICPGSDKCVDLRSDPQRCGHCETICPDGVPCFNGQCGCPNGGHACGTDCCPAGRRCCSHVCCDAGVTSCSINGTCQPACPTGQKRCPSGSCAACCADADCPGGTCQSGVCHATGWSCAGLSKFDWCDHGQKGNCICVPNLGSGPSGLVCVAAADGCIHSSPGVCAPCAGCADGTSAFCVLANNQTDICVGSCHN